MKPSSRAVLDFLRTHPEGLTSQTAFRALHCTRLAARVADLRADGWRIESVPETDGKSRWARYYLIEPARVTRGVQEALSL